MQPLFTVRPPINLPPLVSFQGNMVITVTHGGDPIPKSPFHITVAPPLDIGKVKVEGLDNSKFQTLK